MTYRVCFVCTGNICRSPMAREAVFRARVEDAGLDDLVEADSAGTGGWHEGEGADPRTVAVLAANGYRLDDTARQFQQSWFSRLDLVVALDAGHLQGPAAARPHGAGRGQGAPAAVVRPRCRGR
ncbi:Putative low molecular weight protein-tyrosine-phosphatase [Streptomyces tendae]